MNKEEFCVGIDVGKDELYVSVAQKKVKCFSNNRSGIRSLVKWALKNAGDFSVRYCMEATGVYSLFCAYTLRSCDESSSISVVNPAQINSYGKAQLRRCKTDKVDADLIRSFAETQELNDWRPVSSVVLHLSQLVAQCDALRSDLRQWKNRKHAQSFQPELDKSVRKSQLMIERVLENQLTKLETAIRELCQSDKVLRENVELLCSIPGVAELTAVRMLAYGKSTLIEYDRKELTAHAGLAPRHHQSGSSVRGRSRIAKQGDKRLRTTLFMPVLVGIMRNPILKKLYKRLCEAGKPKMVAVVACMRKLLLIMQAMLKKQQPFNPNYA